MSEQPSGEKQISSPKYLSLPWCIGLVAGCCVIPAVAGTIATEVGGWLDWAIWFVAWGIMFVVAGIAAHKYANPKLPLICGAMIGVTAPKPSDAWLRQIAGEGWGKSTDLSILLIRLVIGMAIFSAIAERRKSSSAG